MHHYRGSSHAEGGEPIDEGRLRVAAEWVAEHRLRYERGTLESGLSTALTMGKALGRLCSRVEDTLYGDPTPDALDAVVELAVFAWWTSASGSHGTATELQSEHALRLTQAMVDAGKSEWRDDDDWDFWLRCVVGSASDVIDRATEVWLEPDSDYHALESEHHSTPLEQLEHAARSLLTTCIEALALFGNAQRATP